MQLGTLSGNPIAAAAGLKTMEILRREGAYETLHSHGQRLQKIQSDALSKAQIPHQVCGDTALFDLYFTDQVCRDYRSAKHDNPQTAAIYNQVLRKHSVFKSPAKLYPSLALTEEDFGIFESAVSNAVEALCR